MSNTRNDIAKLIEQIRQDNSLLDSIKPSVFESVVAEAVAQNNEILEVKKHALGQLGYIGKIRDH